MRASCSTRTIVVLARSRNDHHGATDEGALERGGELGVVESGDPGPHVLDERRVAPRPGGPRRACGDSSSGWNRTRSIAGEGDRGVGLPRVCAQLPLVGPTRAEGVDEVAPTHGRRPRRRRIRCGRRRSSTVATPRSNAVVSSVLSRTSLREVPQRQRRRGRVDVAEPGEQPHRDASGRRWPRPPPRASPERCPTSRPRSSGARRAPRSRAGARVGAPSSASSSAARQVGAVVADGDRPVAFGVEFGPVGGAEHERHVGVGHRLQMRLLVVGMRRVRRACRGARRRWPGRAGRR